MYNQRPEQWSDLYATALSGYHAGLNMLPVRANGSKRPALDGWKIYQQRRVTLSELQHWFQGPERGVAVVTGEISGGLEALDIDSPQTYQAWLECIREHRFLRPVYQRIARGYLEATPDGGRHLLYRCAAIGRNQTLARRPLAGEQGYQMLIETRGNGGLLIIAPSNGHVHPSGKPYRLLSGGVSHIATITPEERSQLLALARTFDETPAKLYEERSCYQLVPSEHAQRPGDLFNQSARWEDILCPHGWKLVRKMNDTGQWRRPGKRGPGISATTNYAGNGLLYVFSTATIFEPERGYTKFTAYALLEHGGDFAAAARSLA
jgi:putative DNA primase/helicase